MKLIDKYDMSEWAYEQCWNGNDTEEIRNLIVEEWYAYLYCKFIGDVKEVKNKISDKSLLRKLCNYKREKWEQRMYDENTRRIRNEQMGF